MISLPLATRSAVDMTYSWFAAANGSAQTGVMRNSKLLLGAVIAFGIAGIGLAWLVTEPHRAFPEANAASLEQGGDPVRGKLMFDAGDCASCHASPGQDNRLRLGGGLALASPFGTFYPP